MTKPLKSPKKCYCFQCQKRYQLVLTRSEFFRLKKKAEEALKQDLEEARFRFQQQNEREMSPYEEKKFIQSFLDPLWLPCPDCLTSHAGT